MLCLFLSAAFLIAGATTSRAQIFSNIIYFTTNSYPNDLILSDSTFYGTTQFGGSGLGNVYRIGIVGTGYTNLHSFTGGTLDGETPLGSLVLTGSMLYGTTSAGGNSYEVGTFFRVNTDGTGYTKLFSFVPRLGQNPIGSLVQSGSKFYGMTANGTNSIVSPDGRGTVFRINDTGTGCTNLHVFGSGSDGSSPHGSLILAGSTLYGTTLFGGTYDKGTVFKINTDGSGYTNLHSFSTAPNDGEWPLGSLTLAGSTLYGMTEASESSNGTVFKINTDGTGFAVLYGFGLIAADGYFPRPNPDAAGSFETSLIVSGTTLYGYTRLGGSNDYGTVFQINIDGSGYQILHNFTSQDSGYPTGSMILSNSTLYGIAGRWIFKIESLPTPLPLLLTITTPSPLPSGAINVAYSQTLAATGGTLPYAWSVVSNSLPLGLSLVASSGAITGTTTIATTTNFTVRVTDSGSQTNYKDFSLTFSSMTEFQTWQAHYFTPGELSDPAFSGPDADPLGKGISNTNQFLAGFNPTNSAAYPHIMSIAAAVNDVNVTYLGASGDSTYAGGPSSRTNVLEFTAGTPPSFTNDFVSTGQTNVLFGGTGLGQVATFVHTNGATGPARYYRVRVLLP